MATALPPRFLEKVSVTPGPLETPCWIWTAHLNAAGYGTFGRGTRAEGKALAHRFAYETVVGPVPDGLELDHLYRMPACANPDHLEPVTHLENVRRGARNQYADATSCINGHEFTPENTRIDGDGERVCRACHRQRCRDSRQRAKAA